ncbi:N-acetylglutaminylglutamine synthetase [Afifella sp. H1R]|uniref:N-acetylglutaminylglutamine synthetase n=1 Tax=Afifella sp. H1R TaxID=2908841 RepID=UPI001F37D457|nr:N-acetylglutaminylglutamine synthetase [Afifella sp. H1R]MCF1503939.1 N-acetylglutaminylglutamine synthetase [Afifella sp. H1R]
MSRRPDKKGQGKRANVVGHRLLRMREQGTRPHLEQDSERPHPNAVIDCGWGRILFTQTFETNEAMIDKLGAEGPDRRDIAFYVRDPHVVLAAAPNELFLDPSHTYRLDLTTYRAKWRKLPGFFVRRLTSLADAETVNRIYASRNMVQVDPEFFWSNRDSRALTYFVAEDETTGEVIATVTGVDHQRAFNDPERGSSLWCLAVDPQAPYPGIGEAMVRRLAEHYQARGAAFMDLSVLHDNDKAINLYDKLGFRRIPIFAVKRKNPINEKLFSGPDPAENLNPYARIIVDEARRRGIDVEVIDDQAGFFRLSSGGRSVRCRESLSELTSAVSMSLCDDKSATRRIVEKAGVKVPAQMEAGEEKELEAFVAEHKSVVVKPARGEQGRGVAVDLDTLDDVKAAIEEAKKSADRVVLESYFSGTDLRLIVINFRLVAAAIRVPAQVVGDGKSSVRDLIVKQSRRREAATGGESKIPLDGETERCIARNGFSLGSVLPEGETLQVRKSANLHTGGTIHDVTAAVHPTLVEAAISAARAIDIPVVGIDLMVTAPHLPEYVFIEANERPGLANHEPQPTAQRFVDLLFPLSMPASVRMAQERKG